MAIEALPEAEWRASNYFIVLEYKCCLRLLGGIITFAHHFHYKLRFAGNLVLFGSIRFYMILCCLAPFSFQSVDQENADHVSKRNDHVLNNTEVSQRKNHVSILTMLSHAWRV
jgi:hypothetical protein